MPVPSGEVTISNGTERQLMRAEKQFMRHNAPVITIPATGTQYKFSLCSELNMEQLQIIMVMLACVPGIPVEKTLYPFA
jgi:hypothetical protein